MKEAAATEAAGSLHLERCVRLLPHDNDSSGFFVAVLEKVGDHAADAGLLHDFQESFLPATAEFGVELGQGHLAAISANGRRGVNVRFAVSRDWRREPASPKICLPSSELAGLYVRIP